MVCLDCSHLCVFQVSKLKDCLEKCAALLDYHHHNRCSSSGVGSTAKEHGDPAHHRQVYLGVASLLSHLLHLIPHSKVSVIVGCVCVCVCVGMKWGKCMVCM